MNARKRKEDFCSPSLERFRNSLTNLNHRRTATYRNAGSYLAVLEFPVRPVHLFAGAPHQVDGVRERRLDEAEAFGRRLLAAREIDDDGAPSGSGGQSGWRGCYQIRSICSKPNSK